MSNQTSNQCDTPPAKKLNRNCAVIRTKLTTSTIGVYVRICQCDVYLYACVTFYSDLDTYSRRSNWVQMLSKCQLNNIQGKCQIYYESKCNKIIQFAPDSIFIFRWVRLQLSSPQVKAKEKSRKVYCISSNNSSKMCSTPLSVTKL